MFKLSFYFNLSIILLCSIFLYGQDYNYALYDVDISIEYTSENANVSKSKVLQQMINGANNSQMEVYFEEQISLCKPREEMGVDDQNIILGKGALVFLGIENDLYIDNSTCTIYKKSGNDSYAHLVKMDRTLIDWEITSDEKKVSNLLYRKAYATVTINSKEYEVVAWFCPSIPVQTGPSYFYDLPGLITEVYVVPKESRFKYSLVLEKLNYDPKLSKIEVPLDEYEIYTDEESQKIFRGQRGKNFGKN